MAENDKKPRLRFKGFTDSWEQRKLGEVANIQKGQQLGKTEMSGLGTYYVLNGGMEPSGFSDRYNVSANTISISEGGNSCGYVAFNIERFWSGGHNYTLQNPKIHTIYLYQWLKKQEKSIMALRVGSGLPNIQKSALQEVIVSYPNNEEQRAIAASLMKLDELITLHQRKYEKLKNIKKASLDKMFPQKNSQIPLIRFKNFTNSWEQRKLKELVSYNSSSLTATDTCETGEFDLYDANTIIGKTNVEPIKTEYITIIKDGAGVGRIRKMPANTMFIGTMGGLQAEKSDLSFIFSLLTKFNLGNEFKGSTIPHIYFKDYGNNEYFVPSNKEQQIIGMCFANLDNLITLHQRKYEKLKNIKKAMMEQMFA